MTATPRRAPRWRSPSSASRYRPPRPSASPDTPSSLPTSTLEFDKAFVDSRVGLSLNSASRTPTYTVIEKVFEGGLAAAAGFREGDVVVLVNSEAVTDPDQGAALIKQAEGVVSVAVARLPSAGSQAGSQNLATPSPSTSLPFDYETFMAPGGPGHPSTARPAVVMMTPAGCVSSTCAALAEFWGQVAGAPQFGGQVYSADCAAGTPGEQSMCKNAAAAGLFHPSEMTPVVTFWDGRDWSPYSGKRSLEALAQAIMGALTAPVPAAAAMAMTLPPPLRPPRLSAPEDAEDAARLVCMQRAFQQPPALASSLPPKRPLRPADVPPVKRFSSFTQNSTVELPGAAAQPVSTGEIVWPPPMDLVPKLHVLPAVVRPEEVEAIRDLVGNTPLAFDSDPDTVDGMMSHEMFVSNPSSAPAARARRLAQARRRPAHLAARRPLREALEAIMQPILAERITPFVRQQYAANWKEGTPIGDWSTLTPCYSLIRRYKEGERRTHETHYDQHAIVTVVVSLADFETEYTGGLYVAAGRAGRQVPPLSRGDAAVHGPDLLHGVGVESGERWSWILWYRDRRRATTTLATGSPNAPPRGMPCARRCTRRGRAPSRRRRKFGGTRRRRRTASRSR